MPMRATISLSLLAALVFLTGCSETTHLDISLTPTERGLERTLTTWVADGANIQEYPKEALRKIATAYGADLPTKRKAKHTFKATFDATMPVEETNAGSYTRWTSPMGELSVYSERFQAKEELFQDMQKLHAGIDRLVDIIIGWLESELRAEPFWPTLKRALHKGFRADLHNFSFIAYEESRKNTWEEGNRNDLLLERASMRLLQFLAERGYFTPQEVPAIMRETMRDQSTNFVARLVARRAGLDDAQPLPESLTFLRSQQTMAASFDHYWKTTTEYQSFIAKRQPSDNDQRVPADAPLDALKELKIFSIDIFGPIVRPKVTLQLPSKPFSHNGTWDEEAKLLTWKESTSSDQHLPLHAFANWSEPNVDFQTKHFGRVILAKEKLAPFVLWYVALDESERKEWDAFVVSLIPSPDLAARLNELAKAASKSETEPPDPRAQWNRLGLQMIAEGMNAPDSK